MCPVTVFDLTSSVSLVAELALRPFFHVVVRFVWKLSTRKIDFDEQLDEVTLDLGRDVESFEWDHIHQVVNINHDTFFTWDGCSVHSVKAVLKVFRVIKEHVPAAVLIIFETPHVARDAPSLVAAGLSSCCLNEVLVSEVEQNRTFWVSKLPRQCGDWVWSTTTLSTRLTSAPSRFRPAWLLEGWAGCFPVARRDLRAMVLTSVQGYKRSLLSWEVEAFLGFEQGVSACMLKFADAGLLKSTAISLEAIGEMRTQVLFQVWHCDSLEAVLAGIFGFSRPGPLVAPSTTLEPAWCPARCKRTLLPYALFALSSNSRKSCLTFTRVHGGRMRLSNPCIPQCPWPFCLLFFRRHTLLMCAAALPSAVLTDPVLPLDLEFAVALSAGSLDVPLKKLKQWRSTQLRQFNRSVGTLATNIQPLFDSVAGVGAQLLRQDYQPARIAAAAAAIGWPDHDVSLLLSAGACLVGDIEESHIFRSAHVTAELSLDGLVASSPPPAQAAVIWKKTCDEVAVGYMRGPFTPADFDNLWGGRRLDPDRPFRHRAKGFLLEGHR